MRSPFWGGGRKTKLLQITFRRSSGPSRGREGCRTRRCVRSRPNKAVVLYINKQHVYEYAKCVRTRFYSCIFSPYKFCKSVHKYISHAYKYVKLRTEAPAAHPEDAKHAVLVGPRARVREKKGEDCQTPVRHQHDHHRTADTS